MPTIGPFFYGPDPGPCVETSVSASGAEAEATYSFDEDGRVVDRSAGNTARVWNWEDGQLSSISVMMGAQVQQVIQYAWSRNSVTETYPGTGDRVHEYLLDSAGYPTELWMINPDTGDRRLGARYTYEDCRLTHREAFTRSGAVDSAQTSDYEYDAEGHISARRNTDGTAVLFDYSCW